MDCVKDGEHKNCYFTSLTDPCSRCKTLQQMGQNICCTSFKIIHVSSDQASAQRKAHIELNEVSIKDIRDSNNVQYGFGMLHFCKNAISAVRNYRLTDTAVDYYKWDAAASDADLRHDFRLSAAI